jgi:hypothetical protein
MRSIWLALCLFLASTAQAGVVTMAFTASGFGAGAPSDPIGGTLTWRAASQDAPIEELLSINLTIAGHSYSLSEIAFNGFVIGGLVSSVNGVNASANAHDFLMDINPLTEQFDSPVFYGVQGITNQIWFGSGDLDLRFENGGTVPEPGSLGLVALALLGAVGRRQLIRP